MLDNTYRIPVGDTLSTAWHKVSGTKGSIWAALLIMIVITFALGFIEGMIENLFNNVILTNTIKLVTNIIGYLLQVGIFYIGIKRALDQPFNYKMVFRAFHNSMWAKMIGLYILQILIFVPVFLFFFAGGFMSASLMPETGKLVAAVCYLFGFFVLIYLAIRIQLAMAFMLDKNMNPVQAIKKSFAVTCSNFFPLLLLIIAQAIIVIVSIIPVGIGLIWSIPFTFICYGVIYQRLQANLS